MTDRIEPILVATCGNDMAGDDAFGPLVAQRLREINPPDVEVVELGMRPVALIDHVLGRTGMIVVDAAQPPSASDVGSLLDVDFFAASQLTLLHDVALSSHGISLAHELELARQLDMLPPRVHLLAAAVQNVAVGQPATPAIRQLIDPAARRAIELAHHWLSPTRI